MSPKSFFAHFDKLSFYCICIPSSQGEFGVDIHELLVSTKKTSLDSLLIRYREAHHLQIINGSRDYLTVKFKLDGDYYQHENWLDWEEYRVN